MSSSFCFTPLAITPSARKGSNIRGKMVTKSILIDSLRKLHHDLLAGDVDFRTDGCCEGHFVLLAVVALHVEEHTAAAFVGVDHLAALVAALVDEAEADQVVKEIFISLACAGLALRNLDRPMLERLNLLRRPDLLELDQGTIAVCSRTLDRRVADVLLIRRDELDGA